MSTLKVNTVESATTPTVLISDGLSVSGVSTLSGGLKVGSAITMSSNGNFGITGIMTASNFVGSGANLTGISAGITMADRWHLTGNYSLSSAETYYTITGTWAKSTSAGYNTGSLGSAMTESSGVFTFPSTGIYYIVYDCITGTSNDQLNMWSYITVGSDNTSTDYLSVKASSGDSATMNTVTSSGILDVTNTSTQKVFVRGYANATGCYLSGNSNGQRTCISFIRLGDT